MIFSPDKEEFAGILHILGRLLLGLTLAMVIPLVIAFALREQKPFWDFLLSLSFTGLAGFLLMIVFPLKKDIRPALAFVIVSLSWLVASLFGALPLWMSGHFGGFLDAFFEAMSGFATTGLSLVRDIDHMSFSVNAWRHLTMFLGGQGIVIIALSFLIKATSTAVGLYWGEARDEKILPNVIDTARFIWAVSFVYLILGTAVLAGILFWQGVPLLKSVLHGVFLFMAGFDTGGFTPRSGGIFYYHSFALEIATLVLMFLGSLNFNLHYYLWLRKKKEAWQNIEMRAFFFSFTTLTVLMTVFLVNLGHLSLSEGFRQGIYQLISAHSGCGFSNLYPGWLDSWPQGGLVVLIIAMAIGGGVCSTTGGIKLMRLAFLFKGVVWEIREKIYPSNARLAAKYHHLSDAVLDDKRIKAAFFIFLLYLLSYLAGGIIGMFYGYKFLPALFESTSAAANVGLSLGITCPAMPAGLKITYIIQMWLGRLEFVAVVISLGLLISVFRRR